MTDADLDAIALLHEPARRSLYAYVVAQGRAVSRNEAAQAVGVQRTLAAFHLDRLAEAALLEVTYRRLSERSGPGAGRPAKLYRRPSTERAVSLPPRDYAGAAEMLAETIERSGVEPALYATARERGLAAARSRAQATGAGGLTTVDLLRELAERGYEPYQDGEASIRLRNCPFHTLAREFPAVACGMNLALLEGLVEGARLGATQVARIDPRPGECCVVIALKIM